MAEVAVDAREQRLVENEAMFRDINERIEDIATSHGPRDEHVYEFFCECSNKDCTLRLELTIAGYEAVRREPAQFVVAPGHDLPEIEDVVFSCAEYQVVRKRGWAADLAEAKDPRS